MKNLLRLARHATALRAGIASFAIVLTSVLAAGEVTQHFPAHLPAAQRETAWRVTWGYTEPELANSNCLYIAHASFMRGFNQDGTEDWVDVINDARLSEIHVPYNDYGTLWDIAGGRAQLVPGQAGHMWPSCVAPSRLLDTYALMEVHDNGVRWMDLNNVARRGQVMVIWATLNAGNYRYIMEYGFRDDGVVTFRCGATGRNLYDFEMDGGDNHLHTSCWRVELALGNPDQNEVYVSRRIHSLDGKTTQQLERVTQENAYDWNPEQFTRLSIVNRGQFNKHQPPNNIGYDLIPSREGSNLSFKVGETFLNNDFFVTAAVPLQPETPGEIPQLGYRKLGSTYLNTKENVVGRATVLWHHATFLHNSRDEDFTREDYDTEGAVALTAWSGFHLKPRNLFSDTPLYPPPPGKTAATSEFLQDKY